MTALKTRITELQKALKRVGEGDQHKLFEGLILNEAEYTKSAIADPPNQTDPYAPILSALNNLIRSLDRSKLSSDKIRSKLSALPTPADNFLRLNLLRQLDRPIDMSTEDWAEPKFRHELNEALKATRKWFRKTPGPVRAEPAQDYALSVAHIYEQITGKKPGIGGDPYDEDYLTPFEELWLACLRLLDPEATNDKAREIYRSATGRRR